MNTDHNIYESSETVDSSGAPPQRKNSKIGVASFVLSLVGSLGAFSLVGFSVYVAATAQADFEVTQQRAMWLGFGVLLCLALLLVSFILGVIGMFQKEYRRTLAIVGASLSIVIILIVVALIWIGLNVE